MTPNTKRAPSWLLSSAGRRGSLVRFLRETPIDGETARVVATDASDLSAAGHLADVFEKVPRAREPGFIERTLTIATEHNVKVIVPTIDPEIDVFAAHRDVFAEHGVNVWVSTPAVARLGWDKWLLFNWLRTQGFPTVATYEANDLERGIIDGPVIAKPRSGSSGIGVIRAESMSSLQLDALDDSYIVQELAPGFEVTVDVAVGRAGRILAIVPRRRLEVRAGEVSKAIAIAYPKVIDVVRELIAQLPGPYGALNVQVFYDRETESIDIIEINPRFGGGYPLSHRAGANFIDALLRDSRGEHVPELDWRSGTLMLRYDTEVIVPNYELEQRDA